MALALFMNKKGSTRKARVRQIQKPVSKLIHNVSKCCQMEETVCLPLPAANKIKAGGPGFYSWWLHWVIYIYFFLFYLNY